MIFYKWKWNPLLVGKVEIDGEWISSPTFSCIIKSQKKGNYKYFFSFLIDNDEFVFWPTSLSTYAFARVFYIQSSFFSFYFISIFQNNYFNPIFLFLGSHLNPFILLLILLRQNRFYLNNHDLNHLVNCHHCCNLQCHHNHGWL